MALGYMDVYRVPVTEIVWDSSDVLIKVTDISVDSFIPNDKDFGKLRDRMELIVGRIIFRHLVWFYKYFQSFSIPHILHRYSAETSKRSIIINFGIFNENPSSTP